MKRKRIMMMHRSVFSRPMPARKAAVGPMPSTNGPEEGKRAQPGFYPSARHLGHRRSATARSSVPTEKRRGRSGRDERGLSHPRSTTSRPASACKSTHPTSAKPLATS